MFLYQSKRVRVCLSFALASLLLMTAAACSGEGGGSLRGGENPGGTAGGAVSLQGSGSSFANPLMQKWVSEYGKINPNARINYESTSSGAGVRSLQDGTVDFGASDVPMSDDDLKKSPGTTLHIPALLGGVAITYNLPGASEPLRFSPDVLADIFLGKIKRWDDARIKADNPSAALPAADITVVHRSDSSGTSAVFTDYLSKVSPEWKEKIGAGKQPAFPVGQGGKGSDGVTGQVKSQPNTIGYAEKIYATQNKLPVALLKNRAGNFVAPTLEAVTAAAAESTANTPDDLRVSLTDPAGANAYPISSYTYVLVQQEQKDNVRGKLLVDFLWWALHDGANFGKDLEYATLPATLVQRVETKLNSVTSGGKNLRAAS